MKALILLIALASSSSSLSRTDEDIDFVPTVSLKQGTVIGKREKSLNGRDFFSYLSIPYAMPPTEDLRFKDPIPLKSWEGNLDGTKPPPLCLQLSLLDNCKQDKGSLESLGREDCLYLNVFTSQPYNEPGQLPVMIFIHGGGFHGGGSMEAGPYALLDEDIVLVSINYRLGVFGFLSTEDETMPGNMGLKDQQLALKWVKDNIAQFGGDPNSITLFGQSAGAASVHMHVLSPGSIGLFNRAILQSGSVFCPWVMSENHKAFARDIGNKVGCSLKKGSRLYLQCMQSIGARPLLYFASEEMKWIIASSSALPRVDGDFLPARPEILLKKGLYNRVDLLMGTTKDEAAFIVSMMYGWNPDLLLNLNRDFGTFGPLSLYLRNELDPKQSATQVFEYYLNRKNHRLNLSTDAEKLISMYGDVFNNLGQNIASILHAANGDVTMFLYQLDYKGEHSMADMLPNVPKNNWVGHTDDLIYLFHGGTLFNFTVQTTEDLQMQKTLISLWTAFARTGNPNSSGNDFKWEEARSGNFKYMNLGRHPEMRSHDKKEMIKFWMSLNRKADELLPKNEILDFLESTSRETESRKEL